MKSFINSSEAEHEAHVHRPAEVAWASLLCAGDQGREGDVAARVAWRIPESAMAPVMRRDLKLRVAILNHCL